VGSAAGVWAGGCAVVCGVLLVEVGERVKWGWRIKVELRGRGFDCHHSGV